jgi:transposase
MGYRVISRDVKIAAVRLYEHELLDLEDILDCCGFSRRTWFRVLRLWRETGDVVTEKSSLRGRLRNLDQEDLRYLLMLIRDNPDYFLDELLHLLETNRFISVHYATIFYELVRLNVSRKKLKKIALERNEELRADFIARMAKYDPEELGFLDEMSKDERSIGRRYGRSQKNRRAEKKQVFVRGRRTSTEALLTLDGIVARTVVEGSMTKELFLEYLEFNVVSYSESVFLLLINHLHPQLPKCTAYPGPLSVLVMDNARIHHGNEILELADRFGKKI